MSFVYFILPHGHNVHRFPTLENQTHTNHGPGEPQGSKPPLVLENPGLQTPGSEEPQISPTLIHENPIFPHTWSCKTQVPTPAPREP